MKTKIIAVIVAVLALLFNTGTAQTNGPILTITNAVLISFQGTPNTDYTLQSSTNLGNGIWQNVASIPGNNSGFYSYTDPKNPGIGGMFYRVVTCGSPVTGTDGIGTTNTNDIANISLDGSSPLTSSVGVNNTTQGQYLGLPIMVFDISAQGDTLHLHSVTVNVNNTGGGCS